MAIETLDGFRQCVPGLPEAAGDSGNDLLIGHIAQGILQACQNGSGTGKAKFPMFFFGTPPEPERAFSPPGGTAFSVKITPMARSEKNPQQAGTLPLPEGPSRIVHGSEMERCLDAVRRTSRHLQLAEGVALFFLVLSTGVVLLFGVDNILRLAAPARTVLLLGFALAVLLVLLFRVLIRPFRPLSDEVCALLYEERHPELQNRLINTVLFHRQRFQGIEAAVVQKVRGETLTAVSEGPRRSLGNRRRVFRLTFLASGALLALLGYWTLLPEHFRNALDRYTHPTRFVPPLSKTVLKVSPGHAAISPLEKLRIEAEISGRLPESAAIHLSFGASPEMEFDGRSFVFEVEGQTKDYRYLVTAGDAESEEFRVRVRKLPAVEGIDLAIHPPGYTNLPSRLEPAGISARVIQGSAVEFRIRTSKPIVQGTLITRDGESLQLGKINSQNLAGVWRADRDIAYDFRLEDEEGLRSAEPEFARSLAAVADLPPSVEVLRPGRDLLLPPGDGLPLTLRLEDDIGLAEAAVEISSAPGAVPPRKGQEERSQKGPAEMSSWRAVLHWNEIRGQGEATPSAFLDLAKFGAGAGETILYRARAVDLKGQAAVSRSYEVRILTAPEAAARERENLARMRPGMEEILRRERALRKKTAAAQTALESGSSVPKTIAGSPSSLAGEQEEIIELGRQVLAGWDGAPGRDVRQGLGRALSDPMPKAARALERAGIEGSGARSRRLQEALAEEDRAIAILESLLRRIDASLSALARGELPGEGEALRNRLRGDAEKLREFLDLLEKFIGQEKKVVVDTKSLLGKSPDDFTGDEKEALEDLVQSQEKWAGVLADAKDDLSKVTPQDLSSGNLIEEVVEIIEEIDLARDYLEKKNIELAVPREQSGVALAEELETNIEKWLSRSRDNLKWNMEEPTEEFDVPLADLPSELEDIVGDLIDQEELMTAETEDVTSSWLDSMDEGIGWDAMDGPISNMSAKGVTGNLQPNDMEIGGRSGEGRSGRSLGQFVEETASGKGGRPTPTRYIPDAFEAGEVKDTSREAGSGATGGGKLSGAGQEGLRGAPSPDLQRRMGALSQNQARIRQMAEQLDHSLRRRRYFSQDLSRAIELMASMEEDLKAGRPYRYSQRHREIITNLRQFSQVVGSQLEHQFEAPPPIPKDLRDELLNSGGEEMPREFRDAIRDYYRALAESGSGKKKGVEESPPPAGGSSGR